MNYRQMLKDKNKIVIGLTVRGKDSDKFWFSLFHEIGHILKGHISNINGTTDEDERDADIFARQTLIPDADFQSFAEQGDFSVKGIKAFAVKEGIHAGIIVGRLQKEGFIKYSWRNELKAKYELTA